MRLAIVPEGRSSSVGDRPVALVAREEAVEHLLARLRQLGERLAHGERLLDVAQRRSRPPRSTSSASGHRARSDRVEAQPPRQLRDPGPERGVVAEGVEPRVDAREDLLEDVLGVRVAQPEALRADRVDVAREALDELVPGVERRRRGSAGRAPRRSGSRSRSPTGLEQRVPRRPAPPARSRVRGRAAGLRCGRRDSPGRDVPRQTPLPRRARRPRRRRRGTSRRRARRPALRGRRHPRRARRSRAARRPRLRASAPAQSLSSDPRRLPPRASRSAVSASSQTRPSVCASSTARSPIAFAWAATPAASSHLTEQRATIATSLAENATVSAAAEPPPGASPSADRRSRSSPSRRSRYSPPMCGESTAVGERVIARVPRPGG